MGTLAVFKDDDLPTLLSSFTSLPHLAPESRRVYKVAVEKFSEWLRSHPGSYSTPSEAVSIWLESLTVDGLKSNTLHLYTAAVRQFLAHVGAPTIKVRLPRRPKRFLRDPLEPEEMRKILSLPSPSHHAGARDRAILHLLAGCGLREVEICRADRSDIGWRGKRILNVQGKGRREKDAFVVLPGPVWGALEVWIEKRPLYGDSPPLFCSLSPRSRGDRLSTRALRWLTRSYIERAGILRDGRKLSGHSFRHGFAHAALAAGVRLDLVKEGLRHENISTTMTYLPDARRIQESAEEVVTAILTTENKKRGG